MWKRDNTVKSCKYNAIINIREMQKAIAEFFSGMSGNKFCKSLNEKIQKYLGLSSLMLGDLIEYQFSLPLQTNVHLNGSLFEI